MRPSVIGKPNSPQHWLRTCVGCSPAIWIRSRIASPEMFPEAEMLPHLICSRPMFIGGGNYEAGQHWGTGRVGGSGRRPGCGGGLGGKGGGFWGGFGGEPASTPSKGAR